MVEINTAFTSLLQQIDRDTEARLVEYPTGPVGSLHFRGDIRRDVVGQCVGTTQMLVPLSASYDEATDLTTVGYRPATMTDINAEMDLHGVPAPQRGPR